LKSKLEKKRKTNEYRAYQIKEVADTEEQRAFKACAIAETISNTHLKGLNGLTYFPCHFER